MVGEDRYRLTPIRDVREREERVQRGALASAVGDAQSTERALATSRDRALAARAALRDARQGRDALPGATAAQLVRAEAFIGRLRGQLEVALAEERRAEAAHAERLGQVDLASQQLARARADREVIERHFARWREERKKLAERRED